MGCTRHRESGEKFQLKREAKRRAQNTFYHHLPSNNAARTIGTQWQDQGKCGALAWVTFYTDFSIEN